MFLTSANPQTLTHFLRFYYFKKLLLFLCLWLVTRPISLSGPSHQVSRSSSTTTSDSLDQVALPSAVLQPTINDSTEAILEPLLTTASITASAVREVISQKLRPRESTKNNIAPLSTRDLSVSEAPAKNTASIVTSDSTHTKQQQWSVDPYWSFFGIMHLLLLVDYLGLVLEDRLITRKMTHGPSVRFRSKATTWKKRGMRVCYHLRQAVKRQGSGTLVLIGLLACVAVSMYAALAGSCGVQWQEMYPPLRWTLVLEACGSLCVLLQPLQYMLPLPSTIPFQSGKVVFGTEWLVSVIIGQSSTYIISIIQFLIILCYPSKASISAYFIQALLCVISIGTKATDLHLLYKSSSQNLRRLNFVYKTFPVPVQSAVMDQWQCGICFEADDEKRKCLLMCTHILHADCLFLWMHRQAFCPLCFLPILPTSFNRRRVAS